MKRKAALVFIAGISLTLGACGSTTATSDTAISSSVSVETVTETSSEAPKTISGSSEDTSAESSSETVAASVSSASSEDVETASAEETLADTAIASGDLKSVLPDPDEYFTDQESSSMTNDGDSFGVQYDYFNVDEYNAYVQALKDAGFTQDATETNTETDANQYYLYSATSSDGSVTVSVNGDSSTTMISAFTN